MFFIVFDYVGLGLLLLFLQDWLYYKVLAIEIVTVLGWRSLLVFRFEIDV